MALLRHGVKENNLERRVVPPFRAADYFGYLLKKRAILYKNDEPDDEEFFDELFR